MRTAESTTEVLRARWIVPVTSPPIRDGWVRIRANRVVEIGTGEGCGDYVNLGDVALLPRLVNAHTHLEFSSLTTPLGTSGISLPKWIELVLRLRESSIARESSICTGVTELIATGTSLAGEITSLPSSYPALPPELTLACFAETLGLSSARASERYDAAMSYLRIDPWCGLSPHAPYSTRWETITACVSASESTGRSLAMHVAESPEERQLLTDGTGEFTTALQTLGVWQEGLFPWSSRPYEQLITVLSRASRVLLVHGNHLSLEELQLVARHPHCSVVYCPRTHLYFGHDLHPVRTCLDLGIRVALGTDSRASNPDLSLWREVQFLLRHRQDLTPSEILGMGTCESAEALGFPKLGRIEVTMPALLGVVDTKANNTNELFADFATGDYRPLQLDSATL